MFGLFGKKKKKQQVVLQDPATERQEAQKVLNKLKQKQQTDEARVDRLSVEITELQKKMIKEKRKKKPDMRLIKRLFATVKLKQQQQDTYNNYILSGQKLINNVVMQIGAKETVARMRETQAFVSRNQPSVEEVENIKDALDDNMDELEGVNEIFAEHSDIGVDDDEMLAELDDLEEEFEDEDEINAELPEANLPADMGETLPDAPNADLPAVASASGAAAAPAARQRVAVAEDEDEAALRAAFGL